MIGRIHYRAASEIEAEFDAIKKVTPFSFVAQTSAKEVREHYEKVEALTRDVVNLQTHLLDIRNDLETLYGINIGSDDCDVYDKATDEIFALRNRLFEYKSFLSEAIEKCQASCEHDWKEIGHDSHYDYYRCTKCGKEERW